MEEASKRGITVKGGKYLEQIAAADVVVFDKTGTLTKAEPVFEQIITFEDHDPDDMLMLAACLEEHFLILWQKPWLMQRNSIICLIRKNTPLRLNIS